MILLPTYADASGKYFLYSFKIYQKTSSELRLIYGDSNQEYLCDLWGKVLNKLLMNRVRRY